MSESRDTLVLLEGLEQARIGVLAAYQSRMVELRTNKPDNFTEEWADPEIQRIQIDLSAIDNNIFVTEAKFNRIVQVEGVEAAQRRAFLQEMTLHLNMAFAPIVLPGETLHVSAHTDKDGDEIPEHFHLDEEAKQRRVNEHLGLVANALDIPVGTIREAPTTDAPEQEEGTN